MITKTANKSLEPIAAPWVAPAKLFVRWYDCYNDQSVVLAPYHGGLLNYDDSAFYSLV